MKQKPDNKIQKKYGFGSNESKAVRYFTKKPIDKKTLTQEKLLREFSLKVT